MDVDGTLGGTSDLVQTLTSPGTTPLGSSAGLLDGAGKATVTPATDPSLAGLTFHHAGVVLGLVGAGVGLLDMTNALPLDLVPWSNQSSARFSPPSTASATPFT